MVNSRFMLVVAAIGLAFSAFGCAQGPASEPTLPTDERDAQMSTEETDQGQPREQWWRNESIAAEIELTDDQVQAINDLMTVSTGEAKQQRVQERQLTVRYLRSLNQEPYDPALADQMSDMLIEILSSRHRQRIDYVRALRDILTHEQWTKLWEISPKVFQIGRTQVLLGPRITVTDSFPEATQTP